MLKSSSARFAVPALIGFNPTPALPPEPPENLSSDAAQSWHVEMESLLSD